MHEHMMLSIFQTIMMTSYEVAKTICFALTPPQRRDMISALAYGKIGSKETLDQLDKYLREFDRLKKLRNDVVHGLWTSVPAFELPLLHTIKSRAKLKEELQRPNAQWFENLIRDFEALHREALEINRELYDDIAASLD
jgi:hypothetical protein